MDMYSFAKSTITLNNLGVAPLRLRLRIEYTNEAFNESFSIQARSHPTNDRDSNPLFSEIVIPLFSSGLAVGQFSTR